MSTKKSSGIDKEEILFFSLTYFFIPLWFFFMSYMYMSVPEKQKREVLITKIEIDKDNPEPYKYSGTIEKHGRDISFTTKNLIQNPLEPQKVVLSRSQLAFTDNILLFILNVFTSLGLPLLAFCMSIDDSVYESLIHKLVPLVEFIIAFTFFVFLL